MNTKLNALVDKALSRRTFLAGAGSVAAAGLVAGCSDNGTVTPPPTTTTPTSYTDADILNFALNLEYAEAEFYLHAATGSGLPSSMTGGVGTAGSVTGGSKVAGLTTAQQNILNEIAYDEQQHVNFLRAALGSAAVARPAIDLTAFAGLATAAGITVAGGFNPFTGGFDGFVLGAYVFEDVGVTAYNGAAPLLTSGGNVTAAAGIMAVEAYHAAYVRTYLTSQAYTLGTTAYPYFGFANQVSALRALLGGTTSVTNETTMVGPSTLPIATPNGKATSVVAASSSNGLAFSRSTDQVLHIVYGTFSPTAGVTTPQAGVTKGGFFPAGLNGYFSATQS